MFNLDPGVSGMFNLDPGVSGMFNLIEYYIMC